MITSNIKALLIEDNKTHVDLIMDLLSESKRIKTSLETAGSFQQAQQLIQTNKYDLILADLSLPDSRYHETLKKLVKLTKETPIVAITSLDDQDSINEMIKNGAEDCILKTQLSSALLERTIIYSIDRYRKGRVTRQRTSELECLAEKARLISWRADARTWRFTNVSQSAVEILGYPLVFCFRRKWNFSN
ncbi:MAG: response regulator [Candidatus Brocadiaceae bacterium]|nr:response regulator [Candidatus Brocadiaceae bacterium]